jgi:hypothetical protein
VHVYMSRPLTLSFHSHSLSLSLSPLLIVYRCSTCLKNESDCINTCRPFIYRRRSSSSMVPVTDHNICLNAHILAYERDRSLSSRISLEPRLSCKTTSIRISNNITVLLLLRIFCILLSLFLSKYLL